jgi:hypothetical protein
MTIAEKYKAEHVIIPLLRTLGNTLEEVKKEVAYRKNCVNGFNNATLKNFTLDELIGAETMWNEV